MFKDLIHALQFLTRLPTFGMPFRESGNVSEDVPWYAMVGLIIGLILLMVVFAMHWLSVPPVIASVLVVAVWVGVTGALHLDGLGDCGDAWMSGRNGTSMLEVMKDTYLGTGALVWVSLVLLLKVTAVSVILGYGDWLGLVFAPVLARVTLQIAIARGRYVPDSGLGKLLKSNLDNLQIVLISGGLVLVLLIISPLATVNSIIAAAVAFAFVHWVMVKRLGGYSGDVYGALVEISEAMILVGVAVTIVS